jgi:hypothetical protein
VTGAGVVFGRTVVRRGGVRLYLGDSLRFYHRWPRPTVIISDGPYGLGSFPGDPPTVEPLVEIYEPHVKAWSEHALPSTTLWFWNSELGWATVHPLLVKYGWEYRNCHIWNKGRAHVAGNANSRTLRKFPVVTEVCVQYVRVVRLPAPGAGELPLRDWLRYEWERSGLPLCKTNEAAGVKNAATRKYFTKDHLWYFPPREAFERLVEYVNRYGKPEGRPYFSIDGERPLTGDEWMSLRAKFHCLFGVTNVWDHPPVNGKERMKNGAAALHANQKPLALMEILIRASSDPGDVVWEPFGGLCTAAIASLKLGRRCYSAEILPEFYRIAVTRLMGFRHLRAGAQSLQEGEHVRPGARGRTAAAVP